MRDLDQMIDEALDAEERELLRTLDEPGFFRQAFGVFRGPTGWMSLVMMFCGVRAGATRPNQP